MLCRQYSCLFGIQFGYIIIYEYALCVHTDSKKYIKKSKTVSNVLGKTCTHAHLYTLSNQQINVENNCEIKGHACVPNESKN